MSRDIERQPGDGGVNVGRISSNPLTPIRVEVVTDGVSEELHISEFNARRLLASLSLILELPLSKAAQKGIVL